MIEVFSILLSIYCALFIISVAIEDNSIADVFWGLGFVIISWLLFLGEGNNSLGHVGVFTLVTLWGTRLFILFAKRKKAKSGEDPRYAQWRKKWKYFYMRSFFQVYMLQMALILLIAVPLFLIFTAENLHPLITIVGASIATMGLIYESIADRQIVQFLKRQKLPLNPPPLRGKKMEKPKKNIVYTGGLWKYSRNPNYFGESLFWLGISIISLPISYFGIIGYLVITILLLYVSGVPMKEKRQAEKDNWAEYASKTNMFLPGIPKK